MGDANPVVATTCDLDISPLVSASLMVWAARGMPDADDEVRIY
jgi:hypothetical protein